MSMQSYKYAEPFRIKAVEMLKTTTPEHRRAALEKVAWNVFQLKAEDVYIDCLTDSGTSAMSNKQWAAIMMGDESYAGCESFYRFEAAIQDVTGFPFVVPTHQGRAADLLLARMMYTGHPEYKYVVTNMAFDSTRGAAMEYNMWAEDLLAAPGYDSQLEHPFKGNMDPEKLDRFLTEHKGEVGNVIMTITCNTNGGQPVSMANIRECGEIAHKHGLTYYADAARCFENCYFIKEREEGYKDMDIRDISHEMFSYFDGAVMSIKKDGLVNMGGFFCCRDKALYERAAISNMAHEGFQTYGGLAGRDLEAIAVGMYEGSDYEYLKGRIGQVKYLGECLDEFGIPYVRPTGGNGVYIDARKFYPDIAPEKFPGLCLAADCYLESGIRIAELGASAFAVKMEDGTIHLPEIDYVRIAISRRVYTNSHMEIIAQTLGKLYKNGSNFKGMDKHEWGRADSHFNSYYVPEFK